MEWRTGMCSRVVEHRYGDKTRGSYHGSTSVVIVLPSANFRSSGSYLSLSDTLCLMLLDVLLADVVLSYC
jgi:hypothetical protein